MKTKEETKIETVQNPCKISAQTVFQALWRRRGWRLGGWGGAMAALLLLAPATFAATLYLDLSSTLGTFYDGSTTTGDLSTTLTWTLDATGQTSPGLYVLADNMQIGVSPSDFSGDNIAVNMSTANNIGANPGAFTIVSTNVVVTMSGSANCRFGSAFSWTVPTGSTLIVTTTANNNGWNFNSKACTFLGGGIIQFNDAFCANGNALDTMNMPGGTIILNQSKTSNFGGAAGAAFVLAAGNLQFASATALADAFGDWISANVFTINGGTIDNTSGAAGAIALSTGSYVFGGNWTFPGSSSLSLGATNRVALTNNVVITNLANTLTIGGVSGTGFGLTATGPGALVISSNSTFTGPMIVNSGALILTNNANFPGSSSIQFSNTSTFDLSGITGQLTNPNTLALTNTTLVLAIPLATTTNVVVGTLNLGGTVNTIKIASLPVITSYPAIFALINYSNTLAKTNFVLAPLPTSPNTPFAGYISTSNANLVQLVITNGPPPARSLLWAGKDNNDNGPTAWDVQTSFNWTTNTANPATYFFPGDFVLFNDTSASSPSPGQVTLESTLTPSTMTVSNNALNYLLTGNGNLADPLTGPLQLVKLGTGTLTLDNALANTYSGGTVISAGTLHIGTNGDSHSNLGTGPVTDNGTLIFDGSYIVPNAISGSGSILLYGTGTLNLSGVNTFKGGITATNGILQAGSASAFGTNKITISSGAILDLSGQSLGATPVFAQGAGNIPVGGGQGAIDNSGATVPGDLGLEFVTLTGNTTLSTSGGPTAGRWDIRSPGGDSGVVGTSAAAPSTAWLSTGSNAYNLTIEGSGFLGIVSAWVDPKLANIDILAGTLDYEGGTSGLGNSTNTVTVESSAILELWNASNALNKIVVVNNLGTVFNGSGGANSISGPVILTNIGSVCAFQVASGTTLNLQGPVSGQGELETTATGTLSLNGVNSFTGGILQNAGTIIVNGDNSQDTGPNAINSGTFIVNGVMGGATTNTLGALSGTGTNLGAVDVGGTFTPGGAGATGTFTVGSVTVPSSLTLEAGATLTVDLSANNAVGGGTNDWVVVNGNLSLSGTLVVNALGILATGVPYTVISYTGNLSTPNGAILPPASVNGYNFTLDTSVKGQVNIKVTPGSGPPVWNGGAGAGKTAWSQAANWAGIAITPGLPLFFAGTTSLNNTNDSPVDTAYGNITFVPGAGSFVLNGNNLEMGNGSFINNSSNPQTVEMGLDFGGSFSISGGSSAAAPLIVGGGLNDNGNATVIYFNGYGTLSNNLNVVGGAGTGTNALETTNSSANWTLVDSPASTPASPVTNTLPWGFEILAGTFNFGTATSAPNLISTPPNAGVNGNDNQVGDVAGLTGTFNMVNGTLTTSGRFNTALLANATGIVNMSGGTWNLGSQFQGANGSNPGEVSILNVSGGTLNIGTAASPTLQLYVASRGGGTLTVSGSTAVNCGVLDVSRNADGNTIGSTGTVNLNGGTLNVRQVGTATANSQAGPATTGPNPTAAFNFNGGTLVAGASLATFFQGSTVAPVIPITTTVKAGGAIVNDNGFAISILEILAHDSTLGATPDGGFLKLGAGTNTLTRANTYTGPTIISNGMLVIASGGSLAAGSAVTISGGASLTVGGTVNGLVTNSGAITTTGSMTGLVTNSGIISGSGTFATNVFITSAGTNSGTGTIAGSVTNGGLLSPGAFGSISNLTVTNYITDLAGSTTALTLNRGAATSNSVLTSIKGTITYAGTLLVTNIGSALVAGDSFQIFKATNYAGAFTSIVPATPGAGLTWNTSNLATSGTLSVSAGAPAGVSIGSIVVSGTSFTLNGTGGTPTGTYKVLSTTNVTVSLTNWVQVGSGSFDGSGHFSFNGAINPGESQRYYILHSP